MILVADKYAVCVVTTSNEVLCFWQKICVVCILLTFPTLSSMYLSGWLRAEVRFYCVHFSQKCNQSWWRKLCVFWTQAVCLLLFVFSNRLSSNFSLKCSFSSAILSLMSLPTIWNLEGMIYWMSSNTFCCFFFCHLHPNSLTNLHTWPPKNYMMILQKQGMHSVNDINDDIAEVNLKFTRLFPKSLVTRLSCSLVDL